jgi:hypothetical protein
MTRFRVRVCVYTQSMNKTNTTNDIAQLAELYVIAFRRAEGTTPGTLPHATATKRMASIMAAAERNGYADALMFMLDAY